MSSSAKWLPREGYAGLPRACGLLSLVMGLAVVIAAYFKFVELGWQGVRVVAIAAGLAWTGGMLALLIAAWAGSDERQRVRRSMWSMLGSMMFRMGLPLAGGFAIQRQSPELSECGLLMLVLVFFLITLVTETYLSLGLIGLTKRISS